MDIKVRYYIVQLTENVEKGFTCSRNYNIGVRIMVWKDDRLNCYWVVNSSDCFMCNCAKELYKLEVKNIEE